MSTLDDFMIAMSNHFITTQMALGPPFITHIAILVCALSSIYNATNSYLHSDDLLLNTHNS